MRQASLLHFLLGQNLLVVYREILWFIFMGYKVIIKHIYNMY